MNPAVEDASAAGRGKTQILIVDDHPIVREGLVRRLSRQPDLAVCAEADSAADALKAVASLPVDLAIVDLTLPDKNGLELIKDLRVRRPGLPVLVLSMHDEDLYAERCLRAGARGYIMKQEATEHIVDAVRRVLAGKIYLSDRASSRVLDTFVSARPEDERSPIERLSDRELEVFSLIGRGVTTRDIARRLHVSVKTVEAHRGNIKDKLQIRTAPELAREAVLWVEQSEAGPAGSP